MAEKTGEGRESSASIYIMIETSQLQLEPITPAHAAKMFNGLCDERAYLYFDDSPPETLEKLTARYEKLQTGLSPDGQEKWLNWMLRVRETDEYIGYVQATIRPADSLMVIAYHIFPAFWGQGFGREAVRGMIAHCTASFALDEIQAYTDTRNIASQKLLESLGFTWSKTIREAGFFKGGNSDEFLYILRP